jgi:hypothetical protein
MNNLILKNSMAKKTVFTGVINGEKFDNVADYNARMNELLSQGVENISAASSTEIRNVDENVATSGFVSTCTADQCPGTCITTTTELPEDEDLSFYPYMEDDDPHYLDLLATSDKVTNYEAYEEAQKVLEKCYRYTLEALHDADTDNDERREYLEDVNNILEDVNIDLKNTKRILDGLSVKYDAAKAKCEDAINKAQETYEKEKKEIAENEVILVAAERVAEMFQAYYSDIANETLLAIKEHECNCDGTCGPDCKCKCHENNNTKTEKSEEIVTECRETEPTTVRDFNDLLEKIFGVDGLIRRR